MAEAFWWSEAAHDERVREPRALETGAAVAAVLHSIDAELAVWP